MYILEGNIGAGKSTFLRLLDMHLEHALIVDEPIHNWQTEGYGQNLLEQFYKNPKRWALTIETLAMMARVRDHIAIQQTNHPSTIVERSIYSGYYCFAHNGYQNGFMSELEWHIHNQWFEFLIPGKCQAPLGFIYLQTSPEISYQRTKKRNRLAEQELPFDYINQIHLRHEEFLIKKQHLLPELKDVPVLVLDCNVEFENNPEQLRQHLDAVQAFLQETQANISLDSPHKTQMNI